MIIDTNTLNPDEYVLFVFSCTQIYAYIRREYCKRKCNKCSYHNLCKTICKIEDEFEIKYKEKNNGKR